MSGRAFSIFLLVLCVTAACLFAAAETGKVETLGALADASVQDSIKKTLDSKGYRVILGDGSIGCELWLRKSVPVQAKKEEAASLYPQLAESTLVGVISFPQAATDYRGQPIKVGTYTLRYELLPNDGNHLGVAPNPDFLLLVPAAADADPDTVFKFQDLVNLSRKATGTSHPGPLSLVQAGGGAAPAVAKDQEEHWVLRVALTLASGEEMPFALVVKGTAPQ